VEAAQQTRDLARPPANAWFANVPIDEKSDASMFELERRLLKEVVPTTAARAILLVLVVATTSWELDQQSTQPNDEAGRENFFATNAQELGVPWIDSRRVARAPEHYIPRAATAPQKRRPPQPCLASAPRTVTGHGHRFGRPAPASPWMAAGTSS
jgi:hypothetical protein